MGKNKEEDYKYIMRRGTGMRVSGRPTCQTARVRQHFGMGRIILVDLRTTIVTERGSFTTFRTRRRLSNFIKTAY